MAHCKPYKIIRIPWRSQLFFFHTVESASSLVTKQLKISKSKLLLNSKKDYEEWEQWVGEARKEFLILTRSWNCGKAGEALVERIKEHGVYEWLKRSRGRKLCFKFSWKRRKDRKLIMNNSLAEVGLDKVSLNLYVCVCICVWEKNRTNWGGNKKKEKLKRMKIRKQWRQLGDMRSCDYIWGIVIQSQ